VVSRETVTVSWAEARCAMHHFRASAFVDLAVDAFDVGQV
jgi:hypothetical protein